MSKANFDTVRIIVVLRDAVHWHAYGCDARVGTFARLMNWDKRKAVCMIKKLAPHAL